MGYIWVIIAVALGILELCTAQLVSIWFVIGAVVTSICSFTFLKDQIVWQIVVFIVVSIIALFVTKPIVKRIKSFSKTKTNSDRYIGMKALVIEDIDNIKGTGTVEVNGKKWTARSYNSKNISKDTYVIINSIEGVKLMVTPCEEKGE